MWGRGVFNKIDLLPYLTFDLAQFRADIQRLRPTVPLIECAAQSGNLDPWLNWLRAQMVKPR